MRRHRRRLHQLPLDGEYRPEISEEELQDDTPDEGGRADRDQRHQPPEMIGHPPAEMRGEDADRQPEQNHDDRRDDAELERRRQELRDVGGHRPVRIERLAEIAARQRLQEFEILNRQRRIEMALGAERGDLLRRGIGAESDAGGIARHDARNGEDQHRDADHHHQRGAEPLAYRCPVHARCSGSLSGGEAAAGPPRPEGVAAGGDPENAHRHRRLDEAGWAGRRVWVPDGQPDGITR